MQQRRHSCHRCGDDPAGSLNYHSFLFFCLFHEPGVLKTIIPGASANMEIVIGIIPFRKTLTGYFSLLFCRSADIEEESPQGFGNGIFRVS